MSSFVLELIWPEINGSRLPKRNANAARRTKLDSFTPSLPL